MSGQVQFRKKLTWLQFRRFMAAWEPCVVVMEACGGSHYWTREMTRLGHDVKLIVPRYVKPFLKRHKNDALTPTRSSKPLNVRGCALWKSKPRTNKHGRSCSEPASEQLVRQRTDLVNALRAHLYEYG